MTMTIVETRPQIVGGVDTHLDVHVAAALDPLGALLGTRSFPATPAGHNELLTWLCSFGEPGVVGVEGTGAYGAGLLRSLASSGVEVREVIRPNRQARRRDGKSDVIDAVEAARAVLAGRTGTPKRRDGAVEAIRVLLVARRSAVQSRQKTLVQMRHLTYTAPDRLRAGLQRLSLAAFVAKAAALRGRPAEDIVTSATRTALTLLARRARALEREIHVIDELLAPLVTDTAPGLVALVGVGTVTAAMLLAAAGDNPERLGSEAAFAHLCGVAPLPASSGKTNGRHRLDQGGDRQANSALWRIVLVRTRCDPRTQAYVERRTKEGRSKREVIRSLKRYVAREVYRQLPRG
jgi:transposase